MATQRGVDSVPGLQCLKACNLIKFHTVALALRPPRPLFGRGSIRGSIPRRLSDMIFGAAYASCGARSKVGRLAALSRPLRPTLTGPPPNQAPDDLMLSVARVSGASDPESTGRPLGALSILSYSDEGHTLHVCE